MTTPESVLLITDAAASKIKELITEEGDANLKLRISITGGGCSGFQYNFSFDDIATEDDIPVKKQLPLLTQISEVEQDNHSEYIEVLVDMLSLNYLQGATIDYKNDANGERFVIDNPKAKTTCGCGSSFDV